MKQYLRLFRDIELSDPSDHYRVRESITSNDYHVIDLWFPLEDGSDNKVFTGSPADCYAWIVLNQKGYLR